MSVVVLTSVTKRGESYCVQGRVDGREAGFFAHAKDVEAMSREDFRAFALKSLPSCVETHM